MNIFYGVSLITTGIFLLSLGCCFMGKPTIISILLVVLGMMVGMFSGIYIGILK